MDHACTGVRDLRDMGWGKPDAMHDAEPVVHQPRARELVDESAGRIHLRRGSLHAGLIDVGQDRQAVLTGKRRDPFEQLG